MIFIPPPLRRVKKCDRCLLLYPAKADQCTHCSGLSDQQVEELKQKYRREHRGNSAIGKVFLLISISIVVIVIISMGYKGN